MFIYEPGHSISAHPRILIRLRRCVEMRGKVTRTVARDPKRLQEDSADYGQTLRMRRLIRAIAGRAYNNVGNAMPRLILYINDLLIEVLLKLLRAISPLFHNSFNISDQESNYMFICETWLVDFLCLYLANLICQGTDISKYFRESPGLRDNESRQ